MTFCWWNVCQTNEADSCNYYGLIFYFIAHNPFDVREHAVYLWFKPTSLYEDKQLCSLSQTVSSSKTEPSFFKVHVSALILMLLISISIQTEMIRTMFFQTLCVGCESWVWLHLVGGWRMTVCQTECLSASRCWKYCWNTFTVFVCLSLYFNIRMFVCLFNSFDFHESCNQLLLFYYQSTRWPRDAHVEEFTAVFHVNYKSV